VISLLDDDADAPPIPTVQTSPHGAMVYQKDSYGPLIAGAGWAGSHLEPFEIDAPRIPEYAPVHHGVDHRELCLDDALVLSNL
jgi:hypothetical protein